MSPSDSSISSATRSVHLYWTALLAVLGFFFPGRFIGDLQVVTIFDMCVRRKHQSCHHAQIKGVLLFWPCPPKTAKCHSQKGLMCCAFTLIQTLCDSFSSRCMHHFGNFKRTHMRRHYCCLGGRRNKSRSRG